MSTKYLFWVKKDLLQVCRWTPDDELTLGHKLDDQIMFKGNYKWLFAGYFVFVPFDFDFVSMLALQKWLNR